MTRRISASDVILVLGATLRLTRFITTDKLPEQVIIHRIRKRARYKPAYDHLVPDNLAAYAEEGLDCPFCAGFWIGLGVLIAFAVCPKPARPALRLVFGALGLNYLVGHVSSKID